MPGTMRGRVLVESCLSEKALPPPTAVAVFPCSRPVPPLGYSYHASPHTKDIQHDSCMDLRTETPASSASYQPAMTDIGIISVAKEGPPEGKV